MESTVVAGSLYWTDTGTSTISRSNADDTGRAALVSTGNSRIDVALDVVDSKMYWTELGADKIRRANLKGSIPRT